MHNPEVRDAGMPNQVFSDGYTNEGRRRSPPARCVFAISTGHPRKGLTLVYQGDSRPVDVDKKNAGM
jgi:hypothetical protein